MLAHNFYINQVLEDNQAVQFKQITTEEANTGVISTIENLTTATLDRIHRFIRLSKKLNWSFTDLDWVLTSIKANEIDEEAIKKIAKIKQLQAKYKLSLDVLCSFWHDMETVGIGSNPEKPQDLSEPEKILTLFGDFLRDDKSYATQDQNQGISLSIDLLQENTNVILQNKPSNARRSVISDSKLMAIPTDNVLYDNYADYADDSRDRYPLIGLVGYWSMNEGSGNIIRDAVGNKNGTLRGNAKLETVNDFPGAAYRKVLKLDGNGDYVTLGEQPSLRFDGFKNYTIAAWIKPEAGGTIISKFNGGLRATYFLGISNNGNISSYRNVGPWSVSSNQAANLGEWSHVATTYDGSMLRVYINRSLAGERGFRSNPPDNVSPVLIGARLNSNNPGNYFKGQIAEVSIWNVALSAEQIASASIPFIPLINNLSRSHVSVNTIENQPGWFTFDNGDEAFLAIPQKANGFNQIDNSLKAVTQDGEITLSYDASDISSLSELKYTFSRLTTTTIRQLSQKMFIGGLDNLLTLDSQLTPELNFNRFSPTDFVNSPNSKKLDFDGPLGIYFWEIFFHIPFLFANSLNSNQRFEEAQKWYHYIFNPTTNSTSPKPVAYWPMDEGSGNIIGDRTGDNNGTLEGNAQWKTVDDFPAAESKKVLEFDGDGDYVDLGEQRELGFNYTMAAWINPNGSGTIIGTKYIEEWGRQPKALGPLLKVTIEGKIVASSVVSNENIPFDKWSHVATTCDGTTFKIYINGKLAGIQQVNVGDVRDVVNVPDLVGAYQTNPVSVFDYFNGQIAEVSIWDVALTAEQISDETSKLRYLLRYLSDRFWHYLPFRGNILQKLQESLTNNAAIEAYKDNPFDPHAIARLRIGAYEKAIVMKYIDNLLDWGDQLFAQDNRESINQATLLYFLAYDLLGEEPENLGKRTTPEPKTFQQMKEQYQIAKNIPQFLIDLENRVNDTTPKAIANAPFNDLNTYFCAPENEQFIAYWERVEDRLYKIRHSLSIEGIRRQLALFQPAINLAQLVRAVAGGRTPLSVVSQLNATVPHYRFDYMLERAKNITSTLIQLGSSLLSALEKKDAEELALLRSSHERSILEMITTTKEKQIEEAEETLASLEESKKSAEERNSFYKTLIDDGLSTWENKHLELTKDAKSSNKKSGITRTVAASLHALPQIGSPFAMVYGGIQTGAVANAVAAGFEIDSSESSFGAQLSQTEGGYDRRKQEWELLNKWESQLVPDLKTRSHALCQTPLRQAIPQGSASQVAFLHPTTTSSDRHTILSMS